MSDIKKWDVEDAGFWEGEGKKIANRNLWISILLWQTQRMGLCAQDSVVLHLPKGRPGVFSAFLRQVRGRRFIVASSDVHEHAAGALAQILDEAGASVTYLGAEQNPDDLVSALQHYPADALLLSTHNGMALEYARQLKDKMDAGQQDIPVVMGGVLNQKVEDRDLPVPVVDELKQLGMLPVLALPGLPRLLESRLKD